MKTYNDISFVGYSNRYISDTIFVNNLKKDYTACLFDDRGRYEKTVMYVYRMDYRIVANYYLIFSSSNDDDNFEFSTSTLKQTQWTGNLMISSNGITNNGGVGIVFYSVSDGKYSTKGTMTQQKQRNLYLITL